ncbi:hypothetical protein AKJ16_DCAP05670 [Drosera capensis]
MDLLSECRNDVPVVQAIAALYSPALSYDAAVDFFGSGVAQVDRKLARKLFYPVAETREYPFVLNARIPTRITTIHAPGPTT